MIKEQNYTKVAEYTKKAFQMFCKRVLAAQLIEVLSRPRYRQEALQSDNNISNQEVASDIPPSIVNYSQQIYESKPTTAFKNNRMNMKQIRQCTRISPICYGDLVTFQNGQQKEICKMYVMLENIKLLRAKEIQLNNLNTRKMCFQVCSPQDRFSSQQQTINADSMVCLKSLSTGCYLQVSDSILPSLQLVYQVTLSPEISKSTIFRLVTTNDGTSEVYTDYQLQIVSYYNYRLSLSVQRSSIESVVDRVIVASYHPGLFKIAKSPFCQSKASSYYYLNCVGINKRITIEPTAFSQQLLPRQFKQLQLDCQQKVTIPFSSRYYQLRQLQTTQRYRIADGQPASLLQVWQVDKIRDLEKGAECRISNVITSQTLAPEEEDQGQDNTKRSSLLQLREEHTGKGQYFILKDDHVNLIAVEDKNKNYLLRFQENGQKCMGMGKGNIYRFELIELETGQSQVLVELLECSQLLRSNYPFLQKWGFHHEEDILRYSLTDLKVKLVLMRRKIGELLEVVNKVQKLLSGQVEEQAVQRMCRQTRILQLFILYLKIINAKIHNKEHREKNVYRLATFELKPLQDRLLGIIYLLVYNNKDNSQIIISESIFFNHLLSLYPETIGELLEEAIKNLCLLTAKSKEKEESKEEVGLVKWTSLVKPAKELEQLDIQRKYIDIISEVAIDPNDIGIAHYQNKIKEQLFGREKKKIFPKYLGDSNSEMGSSICFEDPNFPINIQTYKKEGSKCFELASLFNHGQPIAEYYPHIQYINSLLKLMRNLCKDRNKKIPKVVEDYGLTQQYMHQLFKTGDVGWEMVSRFLDLYCAMYLVQDPFISFHKKEVKCFVWNKIQQIDFQKKTATLFRQFTEQSMAVERLKQFDQNILPLLDKYFNKLDRKNTKMESNKKQGAQRKMLDEDPLVYKPSSFFVMINVVLQIVNYGFLSYRSIRKYLNIILREGEAFISREQNEQSKRRTLEKIIQLCKMAEEICTIVHGMHLLKKIHQSFISSTQPTRQQIAEALTSALHDYTKTLTEECQNRRKRVSTLQRTGSRGMDKKSSIEHPFDFKDLQHIDILSFTLSQVFQGSTLKSASTKELLGLLQLISERGERICTFLQNLLILRTNQEEIMYLQYSGITPLGTSVDYSGSSRRLLNVMKVKELVDKITQNSVEQGGEERKNEKIYELNNLLSKILTNMETLIRKDHKLFVVCQILLQKLNMHSILMAILKQPAPHSHDHCDNNYHSLVAVIIRFLLLFVKNNPSNLEVMAALFQDLTKILHYKMLPKLLAELFGQVRDQEAAFEMIFSKVGQNIQKESHKEVLFEAAYRIVRICPQWLFKKVRGNIIYSLSGLREFRDYVRGQIISFNFIKLFCLVGKGMTGIHQRVKEVIKKSELLRGLQNPHSSYPLKWVYLRLYHFSYVESETQFDEIEVDLIIEKIFLSELRHLTAQCRYAAQETLKEFKAQTVKMTSEDQLSTRKYTESIKIDFGNLMMEGKETLSASEEEHYLNFMLNIEEEQEFSMLNCLEVFIGRFTVCSIDGLAQYVFKLIHFMDRINIKENTYQSRILSKLYDICELLSQKYGRVGGYLDKLPFKQAYSIAEAFYNRLAGVIQKEGISYSQILNCAQVSFEQMAKVRSDSSIARMVTQSTLTAFVKRLSNLVNNREQNGEFAESCIKEFFNEVREKDSHRMNLMNFLSKLMEVLEYSKSQMLVKQINENRQSSDDPEDIDEYQIAEVVNSQLITNEINSYWSTYNVMLRDTMPIFIQQCLSRFLHQNNREIKEENQEKGEEAQKEGRDGVSLRKVIGLHIVGQQYSVVHLVAKVSLQQIEQAEDVGPKMLAKYIKFLWRQADKAIDSNLVGTIGQLYILLRGQSTSSILFGELMLGLSQLIDKLIRSSPEYDYNLLQTYYQLLSAMNQDVLFQKYTQHKLQTSVCQQFIFVFGRARQNSERKWLEYSSLLLTHLLVGYESYTDILPSLAASSSFVQGMSAFIADNTRLGGTVTNSTDCQKQTIVKQFCHLLIRARNKGYRQEIAPLIQGWNFHQLLQIISHNYHQLLTTKSKETQHCQREKGCTLQFCNQNKLTPHDQEVVQALISILTVLMIAADLKRQNIISSSSPLFEQYTEWRKGSSCHIDPQVANMLKVIQRVEVRGRDSAVRTVYFSLPFVDKFPRASLEGQLGNDMKTFSKEHYFSNLYKLSYYVEQEHQSSSPANNLLLNNYESVLPYLQALFIVYLMAACPAKIFSDLDTPLFFICNIFIFTIKAGLLVWTLRRFVRERSVLFELEYEECAVFWKYLGVLSQVLVLVCYGLIFVSHAFYPVTLILQINGIRSFQQIIKSCVKGMKMVFYLWVHLQFLILGFTFLIVRAGKSDSLLSTFIGLNYEIVILQSVALVAQDSTFPLLRTFPSMIWVFNLLTILSKGLFIAAVVYEITKQKKAKYSIGDMCVICGRSKSWFEKKGMSFWQHKSMEHNIWSYIYFFIYMRRKGQEQLIEGSIQSMLDKENYTFIKLDAESRSDA